MHGGNLLRLPYSSVEGALMLLLHSEVADHANAKRTWTLAYLH